MGKHTLPAAAVKLPPAPRLLVQLTEADFAAILAAHEERIAEIVAGRQPEPLLTNDGACQLLQITPPTLRKLRDEENLPYLTIGSVHRYDRTALIAWASARTEGSR
jgi:hypothetical protein